MPFLPTLAVVVVLAAASVFCPTGKSDAPALPAGQVALATVPEPAFAAPAPTPVPRRPPASLAFAQLYPIMPAPTAPEPAAVRATGSLRTTTPHLAAAGRRPCPGRRCPEPALTPAPRGADPMAPARGGEAERTEDGILPPLALPFAGRVAETLVPAVRAVGQAAGKVAGEMAGQAADGAAGLVRGGAASVKGSVALLAECLP